MDFRIRIRIRIQADPYPNYPFDTPSADWDYAKLRRGVATARKKGEKAYGMIGVWLSGRDSIEIFCVCCIVCI